jgi:hypothetical protein
MAILMLLNFYMITDTVDAIDSAACNAILRLSNFYISIVTKDVPVVLHICLAARNGHLEIVKSCSMYYRTEANITDALDYIRKYGNQKL